MEKLKKLFGGINLTWPKLLIFAVIAGVYTAIMALLPITHDTSFADITISFEVWILFGIIIIMNSKSAIDSALKCFVFFLISQPLVYLLQVPFSEQGFGLFRYYSYWFIWTVLTLPMGFIGYFMKKDKWWGLIILTPVLLLLGEHYLVFIQETVFSFPYHLLSCLFCFATLLIYPICIFKNKKIKIAGTIISAVIILTASVIGFANPITYNTYLSLSEEDVAIDDSCNVYLADDKYGKVYLEDNYEDENGIKHYVINADFNHAGKTELIVEDANGNETKFDLVIKRDTYELNEK